MRIVALGLRGFPNIQGGVETHCENLYPRLAAAGHEVIVICRKPYMPVPAPTTVAGVRLKVIACPGSRSLEAFVHTFLGVLHARVMRPDVLHIHAIGPSLMVPLARLLGMRVVTTNHGPDYARQKWSAPAKAVLRWGERLGAMFSNEVIAISRPIADHLRVAFGREAVVIPNGVVIRPAPVGRDALERFGLVEGRYLLAVGRLVPEKGFHDLIEAFASMSIDVGLVIAGRADHADAYSVGLIEQARMHPDVVMTGFVTGDTLAQLYGHARAFVLPSYHEGLPIALLEAMSYGLCALASDIPANRQVGLDDACYFPPGNPAALRDCIATALRAPRTADDAARQIRFVAKRFDWDDIASRTAELFENLLSRTSRAATASSASSPKASIHER